MSAKQKSMIWMLIPVMFSFFTMGFVDLVGIATNYVKADFQLSDTLANLLPSMVFFWFLIFSVPTGMLMNKIGQRKPFGQYLDLRTVCQGDCLIPGSYHRRLGSRIVGKLETVIPHLFGYCCYRLRPAGYDTHR